MARSKLLEKEGEGSIPPVKGRLKLVRKLRKKALKVNRGGKRTTTRSSPLIDIECVAGESSKGQRSAKSSSTSTTCNKGMEPERTGSETESDDNTKRRRVFERTETPTEKDVEGYEIAYVKNFMTSVKDLPEDGIRHVTQLVQLGWDTQGLVRDMEVAMTKLLGEDGIGSELHNSSPNQVQCLRELEELLLLASEIGDNRAAQSDELNNIIEDNVHSLFIEKKKLDDALEAKDCARKPKRGKRIKPSIISNNSEQQSGPPIQLVTKASASYSSCSSPAPSPISSEFSNSPVSWANGDVRFRTCKFKSPANYVVTTRTPKKNTVVVETVDKGTTLVAKVQQKVPAQTKLSETPAKKQSDTPGKKKQTETPAGKKEQPGTPGRKNQTAETPGKKKKQSTGTPGTRKQQPNISAAVEFCAAEHPTVKKTQSESGTPSMKNKTETPAKKAQEMAAKKKLEAVGKNGKKTEIVQRAKRTTSEDSKEKEAVRKKSTVSRKGRRAGAKKKVKPDETECVEETCEPVASDSATVSSSGSESDTDSPPYCVCRRGSFGRMVGCDNDLCPIEWFHFRCVQLSVKPMGSWFCPRCRGEDSRVMKSKQVFLQELEQYNIEEEKKCEKI